MSKKSKQPLFSKVNPPIDESPRGLIKICRGVGKPSPFFGCLE